MGTREYFEEYCDNTTLHGFKYIGERRTIIEKILWSIVVIVAVCTCSYMIYQTYKKWDNSPVIVSFAQNPTPIGAIPFPAVTVCPENKAKMSVFNFTELFVGEFMNWTSEENKQIYYKLLLVCDNTRANPLTILSREMELYFNLFDAWGELDDEGPAYGNNNTKYFENDDMVSLFVKAAPKASDVFSNCRWNSKRYNCSHLFTPTLSEEGICYTFNMLQVPDLLTSEALVYKEFDPKNVTRSSWNAEHGYTEYRRDEAFYPRRVYGSGLKYGLEMELKTDEKEFDYMCKSTVLGWKVILHEPNDLPKAKTQYFRIPIDQEVTLAIQPSMISTSNSLLGYSPDKRNCFFLKERKLKFYKQYTQETCRLECLAGFTLDRCNCVSFYMPRTNDTKLCGPLSQKCVIDAEASFLAEGIDNNNEIKLPCDCKQACHSVQYSAETSQAVLTWQKHVHAVHEIQKIIEPHILKEFVEEIENKTTINVTEYLSKPDTRHYTQVKMFFKDTEFISTQRSELYGVTDFISSCGGIFGLFIGFSILSVLELAYYVSLRMCMNKKLFGKFCLKSPETDSRVHPINKIV